MLIFLIFLLTTISTVLLSVFSGLIVHWYDFYFVLLFFAASYLAVCLFFLVLVCIVSLFLKRSPSEPNENYSKVARFILEEYLEFLCFFLRVKTTVTGKELLPKGRYLLVSNHLSNMDPFVTNSKLGRKQEISWVAKHTLIKPAVPGGFMYQSDFLPMNRNDVKQSLKVINAAANYIKNDVVSVGIYPEGTRNMTGEILLPFKPGALKIAQKAHCPIVVATVFGTDKVKKNFPFRRTKVSLDILKTYSPEEVESKSTSELTEEIQTIMIENLTRKRA